MMDIARETILRFRSLCKRGGGCWEWLGGKDQDGYGRMRVGGRKIARAHRIAWALVNRADPGALMVCHRCDNPSCVRPSHLYLGTAKQNNQDKIARGRTNWAKGERVGTSKLTTEQVSEVFALYRSGSMRQVDIANRFGVTQSAIHLILSGKNWGAGAVSGMRSAPKPALRALSEERKAQLVREYAAGGMTQAALAKMYGVSQSYVSLAVLGRI